MPEVVGVAAFVDARLNALPTPAQQDGTLHGLVHIAHRDLGGRARQHDAALVAALRAHQVGPRKVVNNLGEARRGDVLRRGDVARWHHRPGHAPRELVDGAHRVINSSGEFHGGQYTQ